MAFLDKLTDVAKNIGNKAGDVVENTKLTVKVSNEKDSILENQRKIGEYFYKKLQNNEVDAEVKPFFEAIAASEATIANIEKEKDEKKAEREAQKAAAEKAAAEKAAAEKALAEKEAAEKAAMDTQPIEAEVPAEDSVQPTAEEGTPSQEAPPSVDA